MPAPARITVAGRHAPLSRREVAQTAEIVLRAERRDALLSLSFVGREAMRKLNAQWTGRDEPTDVLAFPLKLPGRKLAGDVYLCPWVAAREAARREIPVREELIRLIVHGVLHVLGYQHPEDGGRTRSPMWKRQEQLVRRAR